VNSAKGVLAIAHLGRELVHTAGWYTDADLSVN